MDFSKWKIFLFSENKLIVSNGGRRAICIKKKRPAFLVNWVQDLSNSQTIKWRLPLKVDAEGQFALKKSEQPF